MKAPLVFALICLLGSGLVSGEPEPEDDNYLGEFRETRDGIKGKVFKYDDDMLTVEDFSFSGLANDAKFFVGKSLEEPNNWKQQEVTHKKGSEAVFTSFLSGQIDNQKITIQLPRDYLVDELTYLSVVSNQKGDLGHVIFNAAGLLFKPGQVLAVLAMGLFTACFLH